MGRASIYPLADRLIDGGLRNLLSQRRAAGDSFEVIARSLATDHGVDVATETVRRWCIEQGIEPEAASA